MDGRDFAHTAKRIMKMLSTRKRMTAVQLDEYLNKLDIEQAERKRAALAKYKADWRNYL